MKVQINDIDKDLWKRARMAAFVGNKTMGELVSVALEEHLGEPIEGSPKNARKQPQVKSSGVDPVEVPDVRQNAIGARPALKEGYGWCRSCNANVVRLPAMYCETCKGT